MIVSNGKRWCTTCTAGGQEKPRQLYWHFPHYHGSGNRPSAAIRSGDFKLIQWFEQDSLELYNLSNDLGERMNLVDSLPGKAQELLQALQKWQEETGAKFPVANPNYAGEDR